MPTSADSQFAKSGDSLPMFSATLRDASGAPVPLAPTDVVIFKLRERGAASGAPSMGGTATIVAPGIDPAVDPNNPNLGAVTYTFASNVTIQPGVYQCEWTQRTLDGHEITYPNVGYDTIFVGRRLPNPA